MEVLINTEIITEKKIKKISEIVFVKTYEAEADPGLSLPASVAALRLPSLSEPNSGGWRRRREGEFGSFLEGLWPWGAP